MIDIRALRRSRGLTLTDMALLTGMPARTLAEIEQGARRLEPEPRLILARVLNVPAAQLCARPLAAPIAPIGRGRRLLATLLALASVILALAIPLLSQPPAAARGRPAPPHAAPIARRALAAAHASPTSAPTPTPLPTPSPTPRFRLAADGPHGCPLASASGRVVLTQGYGEGSHAPADVWGAVDLAIDGDSDGEADPAATQGQPIAATLGGVARVYLGSWPAGNYVRVVNEQAGWSTAYAHLDSVAVADGQAVATGATLGSVGSTGMATGPHLHYEIWHHEINVDPTGLIGCR